VVLIDFATEAHKKGNGESGGNRGESKAMNKVMHSSLSVFFFFFFLLGCHGRGKVTRMVYHVSGEPVCRYSVVSDLVGMAEWALVEKEKTRINMCV
jgi:hypothetical protein